VDQKVRKFKTFDPATELAKLDAAETANQGTLAKYNN